MKRKMARLYIPLSQSPTAQQAALMTGEDSLPTPP